MKLHVLMEANEGFGQDAAVSGERYAFVFDGLGATGGRSCIHPDGRKWKEAKIASHTAAQAVGAAVERRWAHWAQQMNAVSMHQAGQVLETIRAELKEVIDEGLHRAACEWNAENGALPTTVAGWITFPQADGGTVAAAFWAGDSRCYLMDDRCMKLCTLDDVDEKYFEDAMQELLGSGSAPMNNRAGINYEYHLNAACCRIERRALLLCCTDGIYGGMDSPMHMEYLLRMLSECETAAEMESEWKGIFEGNQLLQDDAAAMEGIFIDEIGADEQTGMTSLREMLAQPLDALEAKYIRTFPEPIDEEIADVDGQIGSLARQMCSKRNFHNTLRKNAADIVRKAKPFPSDLPCARILRQMKIEYREAVEEKRAALKRQVTRAQQELDEYAASLDCGENEVRRERVELSGSAEQKIRQNRFCEFLQETEMRFDRILRYMQQWYSVGMGYGMHRTEDDFDIRAINDLDEVMKDMCIFVNDHFDAAPRGEGRLRLKAVRTGRAFVQRRREMLSAADQEDLKMTVRSMVESGETMDETLFADKSWSVAETANIVMLTEKLIRAERELARFEKNPSSDRELSTAALDDYLKGHPSSDARYFIEEWVREQKKPAYFALSEKDLLAVGRSVNLLTEREAENVRIREREAERRRQIMNLWAQYKPTYEAWNEMIPSKAAEEKAEAILSAPETHAEEREAEKNALQTEASAQSAETEEVRAEEPEAEEAKGEEPEAEEVKAEQTARDETVIEEKASDDAPQEKDGAQIPEADENAEANTADEEAEQES